MPPIDFDGKHILLYGDSLGIFNIDGTAAARFSFTQSKNDKGYPQACLDRATGELECIASDGLFVMIGAEPRTDWLGDAVERDERGFILTGADLPQDAWPLDRAPLLFETSLPGVFAAGDVRHGSVKRITTAMGEGATAIQLVHQYLDADPS